MTTTTDLDSLTAEVDLHPRDRNLLLVWADCVQESGEDWWAGIQVLVKCKRVPWYWTGGPAWGWWKDSYHDRYNIDDSIQLSFLPDDWFDLVIFKGDRVYKDSVCTGIYGSSTSGAANAYRAAAVAFTRLSPERQRELLEGHL